VSDTRQALARVGVSLAIIAAMVYMPAAVGWLEASYPASGDPGTAAFRYLVAIAATWLLAVVTGIAWMWPSWIVAARLRPTDVPEVRTLRAIVIAFLLQPAIHAAIIAVGGRDMSPERYRLAVLASQGVLIFIAAVMPPSDESPRASEWRDRFIVLCGVTALLALLLVSRIAWADLNPDGTELLTMGRSMIAFVVPRLPTGEIPGVNLGMLPVPYPIDWLLAIGGPSPIAARLPALGYTIAVGLGVVAIAEHGARRRLTTAEFAMVLGGAAAVCLTIGFNTSYDPYSTDLASPASIDLLALGLMLATLYFLFAREAAWCVVSAVVQAMTRPNAPLLCLMLVVAIFLVERDFRSRLLQTALVATAATLAAGLVYAFAIESITGSAVAEGGGNLLLRLRFLRFDDWTRFAYLIVPGGVVPAIALVNWRRFDHQARVMTLVAVAYFVFFYCLAFISLHHFAPAMLLPLVVLWRREGQRETGTPLPLRLVVAAGLVVAVLAALPRSMTPYRANREVAKSIAFDAGNVSGYALVRNTFDASRALDSLFTPYFRVTDTQVDRVGDPLSIAWYAQLALASRDSATYVVQPEALAPPAGTMPLGTARGFALYTRDPGARERLRHAPPPRDARSPLYDVPRTTLFQHLGRRAGVVQVDMREVACSVLHGVGPCGRGTGNAPRGLD
jgi:hypothetical protein